MADIAIDDNPPPKPLGTRRRRAPRTPDVPTLLDVAAAAGLSTASVSRAINRPDTVSSATRLKVGSAVAALGYVPNDAGRALASARSRLVGLALPRLDDSHWDRLIAGIEVPLAAAGYALVVVTGSRLDMAPMVRRLIEHNVEALLFPPCDGMDEALALAARHAIVAARIGPVPSEGATIGYDLAAATTNVAAFLHQLGHRQFLLLAGEPTDRFDQRACAFRTALEALAACNVVERRLPAHSIAAARAAVAPFLTAAERPTAIVCSDDPLAIGALWACEREGLGVPHDVSIVGFGDSRAAREAEPPLTSLREPIEEVGRVAAAWVLAQLAGGTAPESVVTAKLIVRGSTGSAPPMD